MHSTQWTQPYSYVRRSLGANVVKSTVCNGTIDQLRERARKQSLLMLWLSEHWLAVVYGIGVGMLSVIVPAICTAWWML